MDNFNELEPIPEYEDLKVHDLPNKMSYIDEFLFNDPILETKKTEEELMPKVTI